MSILDLGNRLPLLFCTVLYIAQWLIMWATTDNYPLRKLFFVKNTLKGLKHE